MSWAIVITGAQWETLRSHLFPGDRDEHGAVLRCGIARTPSGTRLLVREVIPAIDGVHYVEGTHGYRKLTAEFITGQAFAFAEDESAYLAVHCHGGTDTVRFSATDMASHERGYPGLLQLIGGPAVGALVFAERAVAGDIWTPNGARHSVDRLIITDPTRDELRPVPLDSHPVDQRYNRQALLFGANGQAVLARQKIAVIGLGGAGSLISEQLARLGVGHLVLIDADRIEESNLSRVVGARRFDARTWMTASARPAWVQQLGKRWSSPKVAIARRVAKAASQGIVLETVVGSVEDPGVAALLTDCDHIFLAADTHTARHVVNAIAHQYLIPVTQVGAKVTVEPVTGTVTSVFSVSRLITPGNGCLWCNSLVSRSRLTDEGKSETERVRQRYVDDDDIHAPSVITLNAVAASIAVNEWMLRTVGLGQRELKPDWLLLDSLTGQWWVDETTKSPTCRWCGPDRFGIGDAKPLPVKSA
jgi:hypothetical protein